MSEENNHFYEFDSFRLETKTRRLLQNGEVVPLAPKVFDTLVVLVEKSGQLIEKDELMEAVWADTFVEEANLTVNISTLRKILGDNADGQSYIQTVPRRGYRFTSRVKTSDENAAPSAEKIAEEFRAVSPQSFFTKSRALVFVACFAALMVAAVFIYWKTRPTEAIAKTQIKTLAILPFKSLAAEASDDKFFGLGMADALITRLSNVHSLVVRPTNAVLRYSDGGQNPQEIGKELKTDAVLLGQIQRSGEQVRITLQLIRTSDGAPLWAETFDDRAGNIFALQDSISAQMADALTLNLTSAEKQSLAKRYTENQEAYELYLKGRYYWFKWKPEDWLKARDYFQKAVEKDPNYALAYAGLSDSYGVFGFISPPKEVAPKAKELGLKALSLDANLADVYLSLGPTQFFYEWDWTAAEKSYKRAFELNPNSALAHDLYGLLLQAQNRTDEAVGEARRALELDPLSSYLNWDYGLALCNARRYDEAAEQLSRTIALEPSFFQARFDLAMVRELQGKQSESVAEYLRAIRLSGESAENETALREAYNRSNWKGFWQKRLEQLQENAKREYVSPFRFVEVNLRIGDAEAVFAALEKAHQERSPEMVYLAVNPLFDAVRSDARFQDFLKRMRLSS